MKTVLLTAASFLGITTVVFLFLMPVSTNFVRFLRWRLTTDTKISSGIAPSHGSSIHYTVIGKGEPVLLLHGGLSNKLCWFSQLPMLAACGFQLILVDSRGHGNSELGEMELSYRLLAEDGLAVLNRLQIDKADIIGWSDGANTALQLASLWPKRVDRVVAISGNYSPQGLTPEAQQENLEESSVPQYWLYRLLTGAGEKLAELENRIKRLWRSGPALHETELAKIASPVLVIAGDRDLVTTEHTRMMAQLIHSSSLYIVHGGGHATLITHSSVVNEKIRAFLATRHPQRAT